jgi:hypothetical protein
VKEKEKEKEKVKEVKEKVKEVKVKVKEVEKEVVEKARATCSRLTWSSHGSASLAASRSPSSAGSFHAPQNGHQKRTWYARVGPTCLACGCRRRARIATTGCHGPNFLFSWLRSGLQPDPFSVPQVALFLSHFLEPFFLSPFVCVCVCLCVGGRPPPCERQLLC